MARRPRRRWAEASRSGGPQLVRVRALRKLQPEVRTHVRAVRRRSLRRMANLASSRLKCLLPPAASTGNRTSFDGTSHRRDEASARGGPQLVRVRALRRLRPAREMRPNCEKTARSRPLAKGCNPSEGSMRFSSR